MADNTYHWQPIATCPIGKKVQLQTHQGVAVYGAVSPASRDNYKYWAPLPAPAIEAT